MQNDSRQPFGDRETTTLWYDTASHTPTIPVTSLATLKMIIAVQDHAFAGPLKLELEPVCLKQPKRRSVCFDREKKVINPESEFYTDEDIRIKWRGSDELGYIKQDAKETCVVLRKMLVGKECFLTMAHRKTSLILASDFKALIRLSPSTPDKDLQGWCSFDDGRRGLERFTSKDYSCLRRQDITNTRETVLGEQRRQKETATRDPEIIARAARETSRRARTFALFFGEADARERLSNREPNFERHDPPMKRRKLEHSFYL
jgi:hypothetical protein